jgi:hypothetical protein
MGYIKSLIFADRNAVIDPSAVIDDKSIFVALNRYINGLPQAVISATYLRLLQGVIDLTATVDDPVTETFSDNTAIFIREGRTTVEFKLVATPFELGEYLRELRCRRDLGVYLVDNEGRVWGVQSNFNSLHPIPIDSATLSIKAEYPTATTSQKIIARLQFLDTFKDHNLRGLGMAPEIHTMQVPIQAYMLLQGTIPAIGGGLDGVDVYLYAIYGTGASLNTPITGYDAIANWMVLDNGALVAITSVTESIPGQYTILFPTITSGHNVEVEFVGGMPVWSKAKITLTAP